MILISF